jgi:methyltransferase family protein
MKVTDYGPRVAPFDTCLTGRGLVGVEVGVDVGAHAEALLRYCDVHTLTLVDPWPTEYCRGYCEGRLRALGFWPRVRMVQHPSHQAARGMDPASVDFVYVDQEHTTEAVRGDLELWWPAVKIGGLLGYRNYAASQTDLVRAVDAFVAARAIRTTTLVPGEIVLWK